MCDLVCRVRYDERVSLLQEIHSCFSLILFFLFFKVNKMKKKSKAKCTYCGKTFPEVELDELLLRKEKICKKCLEELENRNFPNDPEPFVN